MPTYSVTYTIKETYITKVDAKSAKEAGAKVAIDGQYDNTSDTFVYGEVIIDEVDSNG